MTTLTPALSQRERGVADVGTLPPYRQQKHVLFGQQEGRCAGCGTDHPDNLQLLCSHCNRVKGNRPQEYLLARLRELGLR